MILGPSHLRSLSSLFLTPQWGSYGGVLLRVGHSDRKLEDIFRMFPLTFLGFACPFSLSFAVVCGSWGCYAFIVDLQGSENKSQHCWRVVLMGPWGLIAVSSGALGATGKSSFSCSVETWHVRGCGPLWWRRGLWQKSSTRTLKWVTQSLPLDPLPSSENAVVSLHCSFPVQSASLRLGPCSVHKGREFHFLSRSWGCLRSASAWSCLDSRIFA